MNKKLFIVYNNIKKNYLKRLLEIFGEQVAIKYRPDSVWISHEGFEGRRGEKVFDATTKKIAFIFCNVFFASRVNFDRLIKHFTSLFQ